MKYRAGQRLVLRWEYHSSARDATIIEINEIKGRYSYRYDEAYGQGHMMDLYERSEDDLDKMFIVTKI